MYEIFVNDKSIILTNVRDNSNTIKYFLLKEISIEAIMDELAKKTVAKVYLYHPKEEKLLKLFKRKLTVIKAGGGIVTNANGEMLFIKRKGKWDLPKGKKEKGENVAICALREVEEETGVKGLKITDFKAITYHVFRRNGVLQLKETYWYDMYTDYTGELVAQEEEEIEKVKWKKTHQIAKTVLKSYKNIQKLFDLIPKEDKTESYIYEI
ncbi:MAG: NUDIX domain-containing protein [Capnocytophaga sp.]|nr:NUDIX domain-containing protein [Capnocytophaga sp.]